MSHAVRGDRLGSDRRTPRAGAVHPAGRAAAAGDGRAGQAAGWHPALPVLPSAGVHLSAAAALARMARRSVRSRAAVRRCGGVAALQGARACGRTAEARRVLEAELGRPLDAVFSEFGERPVAAASLAQVRPARRVAGFRPVSTALFCDVSAWQERACTGWCWLHAPAAARVQDAWSGGALAASRCRPCMFPAEPPCGACAGPLRSRSHAPRRRRARGAQVYRARVRETGQEVAVKVQRPGALSTISKARARPYARQREAPACEQREAPALDRGRRLLLTEGGTR
jgi:hypothetical protein